jgi:hypothetical protein
MNFSYKSTIFFFLLLTGLSRVFAASLKSPAVDVKSAAIKEYSVDNKEHAEKMGKELAALSKDLLTVAKTPDECKKIDFYLNPKRIQSYVTTAIAWHGLTLKYAQELKQAARGELKIAVDQTQKIWSEVRDFLANDKDYNTVSGTFEGSTWAFQEYQSEQLPTFFAKIQEITKQFEIKVPSIHFVKACKECVKEGAICSSGAEMQEPTRMQIVDHYIADLYDAEATNLLAHELSHAQLHTCICDRIFLAELLERLAPGRLSAIYRFFAGKRTWKMGDDCICFLLRAIEREADINALQYTQNPAAFVHAHQRYIVRFFGDAYAGTKDDHPSDFERIAYGLSMMNQEKKEAKAAAPNKSAA